MAREDSSRCGAAVAPMSETGRTRTSSRSSGPPVLTAHQLSSLKSPLARETGTCHCGSGLCESGQEGSEPRLARPRGPSLRRSLRKDSARSSRAALPESRVGITVASSFHSDARNPPSHVPAPERACPAVRVLGSQRAPHPNSPPLFLLEKKKHGQIKSPGGGDLRTLPG